MQVLITGGAGFIGGHLAESFVDDGHDVIVLDNLEPYYDTDIKRHNIDAARDAASGGNGTGDGDSTGNNGGDNTVESNDSGSYEFVDGDVRDRDLVSDLVARADIVYHQAAQAGVRTSAENPHKTLEINITGTLNVLEGARETSLERVVLASSSSVYGKPESLPYEEDHPRTPVSPYGVSKVTDEELLRVYHELHGVPTVGLRYFTVYGPRMRPNMAISNFVSRCANGEPPVIYGDGSQTRDFTQVGDIVDVNRQLLTDDSVDGKICNVGSTDRITIQELAEVVRDEIDPSLEIEYADERTGDADHTHADISKAQALLGYEPSTSIREGVREFIDWYEANREWYEPLVRRS